MQTKQSSLFHLFGSQARLPILYKGGRIQFIILSVLFFCESPVL